MTVSTNRLIWEQTGETYGCNSVLWNTRLNFDTESLSIAPHIYILLQAYYFFYNVNFGIALHGGCEKWKEDGLRCRAINRQLCFQIL